MLSANNISLVLGDNLLLQDISLSLEPGSVLALVGPNGSGKTSLLRALSAELSVLNGSVLLDQQPLADFPSQHRAQRLAVLPQHSPLNFPFKGAEVVALGRMPHSTGQKYDAQVVEDVLDAVDALHLAQRLYTTLSGGEQQRIHLARVMAQIWEPVNTDSRVLLLDEPTSSLDLEHQHRVLQVARQMAGQGVAVMVILHDLNLAAHYADRIVALSGGKIAASGPASEVLSPSLVREVFGIEVSIMPHPQSGRPLIIANDCSDTRKAIVQ